jgi:hypothetical protein
MANEAALFHFERTITDYFYAGVLADLEELQLVPKLPKLFKVFEQRWQFHDWYANASAEDLDELLDKTHEEAPTRLASWGEINILGFLKEDINVGIYSSSAPKVLLQPFVEGVREHHKITSPIEVVGVELPLPGNGLSDAETRPVRREKVLRRFRRQGLRPDFVADSFEIVPVREDNPENGVLLVNPTREVLGRWGLSYPTLIWQTSSHKVKETESPMVSFLPGDGGGNQIFNTDQVADRQELFDALWSVYDT